MIAAAAAIASAPPAPPVPSAPPQQPASAARARASAVVSARIVAGQTIDWRNARARRNRPALRTIDFE